MNDNAQNESKWFRVSGTITPGNILTTISLVIVAVVFVVSGSDTSKASQESTQAQIQALTTRQDTQDVRQQTEDQLEARTTAILDQLEKRVDRDENQMDGKKEK